MILKCFCLQIPFDARYTTEVPFYIERRRNTPVSMMTQRGTYPYADLESIKAEALMVKFKDHFKMLVILPWRKVALDTVYKKIIFESGLRNVTDSLEKKTIDFSFLRARLEIEFVLNELMWNPDLVSSNADSTKPTNATEPYIKHKSVVSFTENAGSANAAPSTEPAERDFMVDRPFMFFILDDRSANGEIVFFGQVHDPAIKFE